MRNSLVVFQFRVYFIHETFLVEINLNSIGYTVEEVSVLCSNILTKILFLERVHGDMKKIRKYLSKDENYHKTIFIRVGKEAECCCWQVVAPNTLSSQKSIIH